MGGNNIILVGMMCSGKSAAGGALAKMLRRPFLDIDNDIRKSSGKSIADIFADDGEKQFRRLESRALSRLLKNSGQVIATGGGVVCAPDNIRKMRAGHNVVCYLRASPALLARRALADNNKKPRRPLLAGCTTTKSAREVLTIILDERKRLYEQAAHCIVDISPRHNKNDTAINIIRAVLSVATFGK